jgi:hypothetical protein
LFSDDDTVLEVDYFEQILKTKYIQMQLGSGGYINNETQFVGDRYNVSPKEYCF